MIRSSALCVWIACSRRKKAGRRNMYNLIAKLLLSLFLTYFPFWVLISNMTFYIVGLDTWKFVEWWRNLWTSWSRLILETLSGLRWQIHCWRNCKFAEKVYVLLHCALTVLFTLRCVLSFLYRQVEPWTTFEKSLTLRDMLSHSYPHHCS